MKIAIIGAGHVGAALGTAWRESGHSVTFGLRNPGDPKYAALRDAGAKFSGVREAAREAEAVTLATPWPAARAAIDECGSLDGKTVIDCTNPFKPDRSGLANGPETSAGEQVQSWARGANVVKAFNMTGAGNMTPHAKFPVKPAMFICGNDAGAKKSVLMLAGQAGFDSRDIGGIEASRMLENLALLWVHLAYNRQYGPGFAFTVVDREK